MRLTISANPLIPGYISTTDCGPKSPAPVKTLFKAINRPPATKAGISGTKISDRTLISFITGFVSLPATSLSSSFDTSPTPVIATNSL